MGLKEGYTRQHCKTIRTSRSIAVAAAVQEEDWCELLDSQVYDELNIC
jgi:hypothetical protein